MVAQLNHADASSATTNSTDKDQRAIIRANLQYVAALTESAMQGNHLDTADAATINAYCLSSLKALEEIEAASDDLFKACLNMEGLFDTPLERRRRKGDELYAEAIRHLRAAIARRRGGQQ